MEKTNTLPMISVIMPSYNAGAYIEQALRSIQDQTFQDWEVIVIDDHSKDASVEIVQRMMTSDSRIKLIKNLSNTGAGLARNLGMDAAKGRFISFLDADDVWYPTKLQKQMDYMIQNNIAFSFAGYDFLSPDGKKIGTFKPNVKKVDYEFLLTDCVIACHTVMLDRNEIKTLPRFPATKRRQDFVFWLELLRKHVKFAYCIPDEALVGYRLIKNSLSSNKLDALMSNYMVYRQFEKFSVIQSLWILLKYCFNYVQHRFWIRLKNKLMGYG